jgi:uroporphyrinogen-III synthase
VRILVTRPAAQANDWVDRLRALHVDAVALPLLGIDGPADLAAVHQAWTGLPQHRAVMFVSPNAVLRFFDQATMSWPAGVWAAGTGPGTQAALLQAGVPADQVLCPGPDSERFDSEALWPLLQARGPWLGASMLVVRGEGGRDWLAEQVRGLGAVVHFVEAYRRSAPVLDASAQSNLLAAVARPAEHIWLLSSSEAARQLPGLAPQADWSAANAWATHPRIAEAAREVGFGQVALVGATVEAVAAALVTATLTPSIQSPRS